MTHQQIDVQTQPGRDDQSFPDAYHAFLSRYPAYKKTAALDVLRQKEYGRLDELGHVYLDYTGGGLYGESQLRQHLKILQNGVFGNPHSHNPTSLAMTELVEQARSYVLHYFGTTADDYVVIFTPNASGALKLVGESFPFAPGGRFLLAADDHNSVNGIREFAQNRGAAVDYAPLTTPTLTLDDERLEALLSRADPNRPNLFAFPAQSNYSGVKHPLTLIQQAHSHGWDVLLDAAAFVPTNRLDLNRWKPDFVSLSFYKMFGYPTGVGALLARKEALARLHRPWFAGGTVKIVSVKANAYFLADGEAGFEDGTINYLMIPAVEIGLRHLETIGIDLIAERVRCLTGILLDSLLKLHHDNGRPVVHIHGPTGNERRGGTVTMSFLDRVGTPISGQLIEQLAAGERISLRTGCFCNPGAGETTFGLSTEAMRGFFEQEKELHFPELAQTICSTQGIDISAVRVSVGLVSNFADIFHFLRFVGGFRNRDAASFGEYPDFPTCGPLTRDTP